MSVNVRPSSRAVDVACDANPVRCIAANRKSPERSPVNIRPVRLAPCAAGARPTLAALAGSAPADVVILKDGFVVQGKVGKEMERIFDKATGQAFVVPKANGFDYLDDGARVVIFSSHHKQLGEVGKDVQVRPQYRAFQNL